MNKGNCKLQRRFDKKLLPSAKAFYKSQLRGLGRPSGSGWASARCPFNGHADENPSFSVHLEKGCFKCHACGAKGPDIIKFVMIRDRCGFVGAVTALGAWGLNDEK
jgi:hypothetical protein